jgi:hypothetical protein
MSRTTTKAFDRMNKMDRMNRDEIRLNLLP